MGIPMGKILLFYKYVHLEYPVRVQKWQKKICDELGLTGRIILAHEGINGTVGGETSAIDQYKQLMEASEWFSGIDFKENEGDARYFPKLQIKVKSEIVHLGVDPQKLTVEQGGTHLTPEQTHTLIQNKPEDLIILDTRNTYETKIGKFVDAVIPEINNFREFPEYVDNNLELFKDKQVLMYCTGGIRCERATAYLNTKGIAKQVFQIEGGIVRYTEKYPDGFFRGKNYVFDNRIAVPITDDILATCTLCPNPSDDYHNCLNARCNKHFIACPACNVRLDGMCSETCLEIVTTGKAPRRDK